MSSHAPPIRSFGTLARAARASPGWPADLRIRDRSLATLLGKLDRDLELGWLEDRPDVQAVLAALLGCSPSDLSARKPRGATPERRIRFADARYARTFELATEPLPPGLPPEVAVPSEWGRTWWLAGSGAGRTLVGRWLETRGLARHFTAERWDEASDALSEQLPLFLELTTAHDAGRTLVAPPRSALCVAAPFGPGSDTWRVVSSPPVKSTLRPLVTWLVERLPDDSALEVGETVAWLEAGPLPRGELDCFGSVLGLCGALDEIGPREAKGKSTLELARRLVKRRVDASLGKDSADAGWLRKHAVDVLVGMARRALTDSDQPWTAGRSFDDWLALVPEEHRPSLEVDWLRLSLARVDSSIRPAEIERAARKVSPGAYRVLRGLGATGLLVPSGGSDDELRPSPRWLATALGEEARRGLLDGSPFEWGEGLLRPHAAPAIARALYDRLLTGDATALSDVVELEAPTNPAQVVALETAFRCTGLALLAGAEVDPELLAELWDAQASTWLALGAEPPRPRVGHLEQPDETSILELGTWHLAALAISEQLAGRPHRAHELLAPWRRTAPAPHAFELLDSVALSASKALALGEPWGVEAFVLVDRLRSAVGNARAEAVHPLEAVGIALDEAAHGVLDWATLRALRRHDVVALCRLAERRGSDVAATAASAAWQAWSAASRPALEGTPLEPRPGAEWLWTALPPELTVTALERCAEPGVRLALASLPRAGWQALVRGLGRLPAPLRARAVEALPREAAEVALAAPGSAPGEELAPLWQRFPDVCRSRAVTLLDAGNVHAACAWLALGPAQSSVAALDAAERATAGRALSAAAEDALRRWLHDLVAGRAAGWRAAYAALARLEATREH